MSTETRNVFDVEKQKAKDVWTVIKTITPVISIIREWGKKEKEFKAAEEEADNLLCAINAIEGAITVLGDKNSIAHQELLKEVKKREDMYNKARKRSVNLKILCSNLEKEVISYRNYARLYNWVTDATINTTIHNNLIESEEAYLAVIFFMHNIYTPYEPTRAAIKGYLASKGMNPEVLNIEWNDFLKYLKNT